MFSHFWLFLQSVAGHAVTLLAGCVFTVVINLIEKYAMRGKRIPLKADIAILLFFVFFACFQAWRDQYEIASKTSAAPPVQITNQVNVPPAAAPIVNFPPQMAYVASTQTELTPDYGIGGQIGINDTCKNLSQSIPAEKTSCTPVGLYVVDVTQDKLGHGTVSLADQDKAYALFEKKRAALRSTIGTMTLGPNEYKFHTGYSDEVVDQSLDNALRIGTKTLITTSEYHWNDGMGAHVNQYCAILQPPSPPVSIRDRTIWVWGDCTHHNGLQSH